MLPYLFLKKVWPNRQRDKEVLQMKYIMCYKRSVGILEDERISRFGY